LKQDSCTKAKWSGEGATFLQHEHEA